MTRGTRKAIWWCGIVVFLSLGSPGANAQDQARGGKEAASRDEKVDGYLEWHIGECVVADGQKVCPAPGCKFKGGDKTKDLGAAALGSELKAKGKRLDDGTLLAREIETKANGEGLFEGDIRSVTNAAETRARQSGRFWEDAEQTKSVGALHESGPQVERVRRIVDSLLPPYLHPEGIRIYVIENKEWNAFAMGNYSIYVFTGLLEAMDDDEVAIVVGHELVHASHEHSRKQFKRDMWVQLAALGVIAASSKIEDDKKRQVLQLATGLAAIAYKNGYGRGMEDQADRVGLRYAYEAGYDITKGPRLWQRFADKYGEGDKITNFFFSDHSQSAARATKLEREIAFNYPDGPKTAGPAGAVRRPVSSGEGTVATQRPPSSASGSAQALVTAPRSVPPPAAASRRAQSAPASSNVEIEPGMTVEQVKKLLGEPTGIVRFGDKARWTYPDLTVVFEKGKVADVMF